MNLIGKIIIAPPKVRGNFWQKSVVFITEHNSRSSVGLTLNKPSQMTIKEFAQQHNVDIDVEGFVHIGGPVNVKAFTMLHTSEWSCENTMQVNEEFSLSSSPSMLRRLAMGSCPKQWRLFVGLAGWAAGQLESEIKGTPPYTHNLSWLTAQPSTSHVFDLNGPEQWAESIERSGSEFAQSILV